MVYKSAFAEPPWDEFRKCAECNINYGIKESESPPDLCKKCLKPLNLIEFWSTREIKSDLEFALSQDCPIMLVAESKGEIAGFTWGYKLPMKKFPFLNGLIALETNYMDEIAVSGNMRRRGIGRIIGREYIQKTMEINIPEIVLRTDKRNGSSMALFKSLGFEDMQILDPEYEFRTYLRRKLA